MLYIGAVASIYLIFNKIIEAFFFNFTSLSSALVLLDLSFSFVSEELLLSMFSASNPTST